MTKKIILKDSCASSFDSDIPQLSDNIKPGDLFVASERFYRYLRRERVSFNVYFYTLKEICNLSSNNNFPILMYIGEKPKSFYKDHVFLLKNEFCYLYEDDFWACLPITLSIQNG